MEGYAGRSGLGLLAELLPVEGKGVNFTLLLGIQPFSGPNITSMTESDVPIVRHKNRRASRPATKAA